MIGSTKVGKVGSGGAFLVGMRVPGAAGCKCQPNVSGIQDGLPNLDPRKRVPLRSSCVRARSLCSCPPPTRTRCPHFPIGVVAAASEISRPPKRHVGRHHCAAAGLDGRCRPRRPRNYAATADRPPRAARRARSPQGASAGSGDLAMHACLTWPSAVPQDMHCTACERVEESQ
jgi:hypothetical protein